MDKNESAHCRRASDVLTLHSAHCDHSLVDTLPDWRHISEGQQMSGLRFHTIWVVGILGIPISSKVGIDTAVESETGKIGLDVNPFINGGLQTPGNALDGNSVRLLWIDRTLGS